MTVSVPPVAVGYCAAPAVFCELVSNAPGAVTIITGVLASVWYGVQLYNAFKKKDNVPPSDQSKPR